MTEKKWLPARWWQGVDFDFNQQAWAKQGKDLLLHNPGGARSGSALAGDMAVSCAGQRHRSLEDQDIQ